MAHQEMNTVKVLDRDLLHKVKAQTKFIYALHDDWVGTNGQEILQSLGEELRMTNVKVLNAPHAFCISEFTLFDCSSRLSHSFKSIAHSQETANVCAEWLNSL